MPTWTPWPASCICAKARRSRSTPIRGCSAVLDRNPIFEVVDRDARAATRARAGRSRDRGSTRRPSLGPRRSAVSGPRQGAALSRRSRADRLDTAALDGDTLGLEIDGGWRPAGLSRQLRAAHAGAAGTGGRRRPPVHGRHALARRRDDRARASARKTGRRMGHISMSGPDGAIARLRGVPVGPAHLHPHQQHQPGACSPTAPSAPSSRRAGWEVAYDGMELTL